MKHSEVEGAQHQNYVVVEPGELPSGKEGSEFQTEQPDASWQQNVLLFVCVGGFLAYSVYLILKGVDHYTSPTYSISVIEDKAPFTYPTIAVCSFKGNAELPLGWGGIKTFTNNKSTQSTAGWAYYGFGPSVDQAMKNGTIPDYFGENKRVACNFQEDSPICTSDFLAPEDSSRASPDDPVKSWCAILTPDVSRELLPFDSVQVNYYFDHEVSAPSEDVQPIVLHWQFYVKNTSLPEVMEDLRKVLNASMREKSSSGQYTAYGHPFKKLAIYSNVTYVLSLAKVLQKGFKTMHHAVLGFGGQESHEFYEVNTVASYVNDHSPEKGFASGVRLYLLRDSHLKKEVSQVNATFDLLGLIGGAWGLIPLLYGLLAFIFHLKVTEITVAMLALFNVVVDRGRSMLCRK